MTTMNIRTSRKWWIAAAAVVMQLCFGAAYGWSVFVKPLVNSEHWTLTQVSMNFSLAIFCLGIGTVVGGMWLDRVGPRVVASVAGLLYGLGYVLAAFAVAHHSLLGLYLSYGVLAGFGMGMGYICPVSTLVKWFPDKRGLMTGIAVCGYGVGALVMSAIAAPQIAAHGVPVTFLILGAAYAILVIATAQFYQNPPETRLVPGLEARTHATRAAQSGEFSVSEAMRTPQFWLLWTMLFVNVSAGIMIISQASPMSQQLAGFTPVAAAGVVGVIALFNGLGEWSGRQSLTTSVVRPYLSSSLRFRPSCCSRCPSSMHRYCSRVPWPWLDLPTVAASAPCLCLLPTFSARKI